VRVVGSINLKKDDLIADKATDKRYLVSQVADVAAIRHVPLAQQLVVEEVATSSHLYKVD
jgi:hypothetical protein